MSRETFLWHDYETFGTHPALDRPAQFAAVRTAPDLEEIGAPLTWYCKPSNDFLPHPAACLVTGITPQDAAARGVVEAEFASLIQAEMMEPGTCSAGYNNLRFDDEFTRHLLYRNFFDAYEREYKNGNSRWDLINLARMCYALRPDGVEWPEREPGVPSFRLEDLTDANGIEHSGAHDALVDVRATIGLARLLRARQPRLYEWALGMRRQAGAMRLLNTVAPEPVVHTSGRIPAARGCTTLVLPLAVMPDRPKSIIVFDLMSDPAPLMELDAEDIADRVFTPAADLPEGLERIPLKAVHTNKVPMLAPAGVLRDADAGRIGLNIERCQHHAAQIQASLSGLRGKLMDVFARPHPDAVSDPDVMLYSGGFFSARDRATLATVRQASPAELGERDWPFQDARLPEMLFRYRARNYPDSLSAEDWSRWNAQRAQRLLEPRVPGQLGLHAFRAELELARQQHAKDGGAQRILDQLEAWGQSLDLGQPPEPAV